jgi:hypothetical protein
MYSQFDIKNDRNNYGDNEALVMTWGMHRKKKCNDNENAWKN